MSVPFESRLMTTSGLEKSHKLLSMIEIFEPENQIVIVERDPDRVIDTYFATMANHMGDGFRFVLKGGSMVPHHWFPEYSGKEVLVADLNHLLEIYIELIGCPSVGIRLEIVDRAMCPRFHVDNVGIRMLCTYRGPGTEWLEDVCADRSKLGSGCLDASTANAEIVLNPAGIHCAFPYDIILLKGSGWQGNEGRGIIHRSPAVPENEASRILLALDAIW